MASISPDRLVVDAHFKEFLDAEYPGDTEDDVFERYAVTQVLKPKELSTEELLAGIVDGQMDGGIDSFYVFLEGGLISPDDPVLSPGDPSLHKVQAKPELSVFLIQTKNTDGWAEATWEHLLSSLDKLLDLSMTDTDLEKLFRSAVVERTGILRKAIRSLGSKFPRVSFKLKYVTKAPEANLTETVSARAEQVRRLVANRLTTGAEVTAEHIGVESLYTLAGRDYSAPAVLNFRTLIRERDSFIGVASIRDYLSFVRDPVTKALREELFDSNVRDFEGDNVVNEAIGQTLASQDSLEFWWMNNGVTVLGDKVDSPQQTLTISRPLIVNGLQTSHVLDRAERENKLAQERLDNGVVVRVIVSTDEDIRDRVIAGTNRQTQVPGPALYATQELQRDIERFFKVHDWYYERRKNRYKNRGVPAKRRITMGLLAQTMITLLLGLPDAARARPSTLLGRKENYDEIFPTSLDREAYLRAIELLKAVEEFLSSDEAKAILDESTNARFYVLAGYTILQLRIKDTTNLRFDTSHHRLKGALKRPSAIKALTVLASTAASFQTSHTEMSRDTIFKSGEFREAYFSALTGHPANATSDR
ncbi:hypothetical protein BJY16_001832 [Actinoplanes octamycinicus]|uniref:Abortive phage infection protein C-terminal domain-containing protein n=1 Tax=Actinoplanes octamycinicus TaxID=135948 RepID=A0A7W7GU60_9ACTN|nr:AIPR family protein [Actinoplanes octamycinicus]MBB4738373.1 hypothetical protein [Actinoplanes octamycinicus]GIE57490.1 hypothetical protein Aoc01nite_28920 [Actinoplanes octamycinicus]